MTILKRKVLLNLQKKMTQRKKIDSSAEDTSESAGKKEEEKGNSKNNSDSDSDSDIAIIVNVEKKSTKSPEKSPHKNLKRKRDENPSDFPAKKKIKTPEFTNTVDFEDYGTLTASIPIPSETGSTEDKHDNKEDNGNDDSADSADNNSRDTVVIEDSETDYLSAFSQKTRKSKKVQWCKQ